MSASPLLQLIPELSDPSNRASPVLTAALTRRAYLAERSEPGEDHERLEWLGDRVLNHAVAVRLVALRPTAQVGELDLARAQLTSDAVLAGVGRRLRVDERVRMGKGEALQGQASTDKAIASHVEALVGALASACGVDRAFAFCEELLGGEYAAALDLRTGVAGLAPTGDPMSELNLLFQQRYKRSLGSEAWAEESWGPDHARTWNVTLTLPDGSQFEATVQGTKKQAKAQCAEQALVHLRG